MPAIEQTLISFFELVSRKDRLLLEKLAAEQNFSVDHTCWSFTLPDLYNFLKSQDEVFSCIDYKQFRQLLFNSPVNKAAVSSGAEVIITDNWHKVDQSIYSLVWHER